MDGTGPDAMQQLLDALPAPAEPLDVVMLDGYLCALLLRERAPAPEEWLPFVLDIEGRSVAAPEHSAALRRAILQRWGSLKQAISHRQWFDPWVYELEDGFDPAEAVAPWAAGFTLAVERFPLPLAPGSTAADDALALIYQYLDEGDWPGPIALKAQAELLEPPATLAQAVETLVRATLLLADLAGPTAVSGSTRR
jgi:uncharacterized protein